MKRKKLGKSITTESSIIAWVTELFVLLVLGNSGKLVTLETLSLTKFSKYVFQEQGIRDSRKPGTCEASNSRMCRVRES
jgi:hypothetical protein